MSHPDPPLLVKLVPPGFPPHHNRFELLDGEVSTDDEAAAAAADTDSRPRRPGRVFNEITQAVEDDAGSTSRPPDLVLINQTGRISDRRNSTTAECRTGEGHAVAVSFWLVEPPDVSYFSVHCPGLEEDDFSDTPPLVLCAEGAFFLFCITLNVPEWSSVHHFVYSARGIPAGRPSLHLLPHPKPRVEAFMSQQFGLLPCGDEHYAVAFLHHEWQSSDRDWHYYVYMFSSEAKAWKRSDEVLLRLSNSDQLLFDRHASSKHITVGESSLGWVDLLRGILLLSNPFDQHPVVSYIQLPAEMACITDKDGYPYHAPEYSRDITCCGDLIEFVEVEFAEPHCRTNGQGWRATTWNRKVSSNDWGRRHTVDVSEISVEPIYSLLLPKLLNEDTKQLEIKRLIFLIPTLSTNDDDLLYMMCKVNEEDDTAWVITVDMKRAALKALVPITTKPSYSITTYCPCAFPEYYFDITPGASQKRCHKQQQGPDQGGVGIFEESEKPGYWGGSTAQKVYYGKKRSRAKKRRHEIIKPSNFWGNVASKRCMLMSISMLALCWMVLVAFEVWTEPPISNMILRSIGTKVDAVYKYYTDKGS